MIDVIRRVTSAGQGIIDALESVNELERQSRISMGHGWGSGVLRGRRKRDEVRQTGATTTSPVQDGVTKTEPTKQTVPTERKGSIVVPNDQ